MSGSLSGRTALVTGASRGIGRATAETLAEAGASVWGLARSAEALAELENETGGRSLVVDLRDDADLWAALDEMMEAIGGAPDIVVNAGGVFGIEACASESVNGFDAQLAVNLRAPFLVNRAVLPGMLEKGHGLIVNVGSIAGRKAFPGNGAYSASKFGLRGYHEVLREELTGTGVRATLVEPAATDTSLWDPLDPDSNPGLPDRAAMLRPDDVAQTILFVCETDSTVEIPTIQVERR